MPIYKSIIASFTGDSRDYIYQAIYTPLPTSIDWRGGVVSVENQGTFGSCHDDITEVLTYEGWKLFKDTTLKDKFATIDPVSKRLIFENPVRIISLPYSGNLIKGSHKSLDFMVTPDHTMLIRKWNSPKGHLDTDYSFVAAKDLGWNSGLLTQAVWEGSTNSSDNYTLPEIQHKHNSGKGSKILPMGVWLRFLGIYLAEGTMIKRDQCKGRKSFKIQIAGSKEREKTFIREVLSGIGVKFLELKDRFTFSNKRIYEHLSSLGLEGIKAPFKFVPRFVFDQTPENIKQLLLGHFMGDGGITAKTVKVHYTSSKELANDIQHLLFLSGTSSSIREGELSTVVAKTGRTIKGNYIPLTVTITGVNRSIVSKNISEVPYVGIVYCAEVPTYHTLVTRRNGKILVSGNCTANSVVAACELILQANGKFVNLSRLFNYYESRKQTTLLGLDTGSSLRNAVAEVKKIGLPLESLWPYTTANLEAVPPNSVYADAATRLLDRYERIDDGYTYLYAEDPTRNWILQRQGTSIIGSQKYINDIKSALVEGYPVVIGFAIDLAFKLLNGDFTYQKAHPWLGIQTANPESYHAVVLVGYDDYYDSFILLNSWGKAWGNKGYALLPYNTLANSVTDSWVMRGFMGMSILPSAAYNPEAKVVDPGFKDTFDKTDPTVPPYIAGASISTLIQGSQLLEPFTTITWVKVLFVKGFTFDAKLKVSYLALNTKLRFWIEETSGDTLSTVNQESIMDATVVTVDTPLDTSIQAYTLPIYSKSGAIIILKVDITHSDYLTFIQNSINPNTRVTQTIFEQLSFLTFISASSNLNGSINRDVGLSLFDNSYLQAFTKRVIYTPNYTGFFHFLNSGFDKGMWVKQLKDPITGDLSIAVANSSDGVDTDFGTPVLIAKNTGTLDTPVYSYPPNPYTSIPSLKYYFTSSAYGFQYATTSPFPYFIAKAADGSSFIFTTVTALLNKNAISKEPFDFDMGSHYLGWYKSGTTPLSYGLGGAISNELVLPDITVLPPKNITGIRIISTGGISSNDIRIKQRSTTQAPYTTLQGTYPVLDITNTIYLSFSEGNTLNDPLLYGDEVNITESGTYVIQSNSGGTITVVTNRLLYNPYYNGTEKLIFNNTNQGVLNSVTAGQVTSGSTEYYCVYLKNRHPTKTFYRISIWLDLNCNNVIGDITNPQYLQLALNDGLTRTGIASENITITSNTETPPNLIFNFTNAESEGLIINELQPNTCVAIWFKRVVNAHTSLVKQDILNYLRMKVMY